MPEIVVARDEQYRLIAADKFSLDIVKKIKTPIGDRRKVMISNPRNYKFHQKFFVLVNTIYDIQNHFDNVTALRHWLIMKTGHYTTWVPPDKPIVIFEHTSIAYESMDNIEFEKLFNEVIDLALVHPNICGGITRKELLLQYTNNILGFTKTADRVKLAKK